MKLRWTVTHTNTLLGRHYAHLHVQAFGPADLHAVVQIDGMSQAHLEEVIEHLNITMNAQLLELRRIKEKFA